MNLDQVAERIKSNYKSMTPAVAVARIQRLTGYDLRRSVKGYQMMKESGHFDDFLVEEWQETVLRDIRLLKLAEVLDLEIEKFITRFVETNPESKEA